MGLVRQAGAVTGFCERRMAWLPKKLPDAKLWLLDVGVGVLRVSEKGSTGKRSWSNVKTFKKVTRAPHTDFKNFRRCPSSGSDLTLPLVFIQGRLESGGQAQPNSKF